ncbi:hypothetical protein, variant [Aphanomyces astaci]|uniref:phosphatidate phosphatase n=1 Tax=Aphanomyces astaci TaxID=112090 RepID=W4GGR5_APHAT|nr:hypothetical protein, variant [Aphanomyces astaci]ETV78880.1 hypothetical protein, variant [Aphanomyces astaci]|eukprot:XP_009831599.1 hypothetical protein, variant [Aphanomyces astaci]
MNVINSVKEYVTTVFDLGSNHTEAIDVVAIQHGAPDRQVRCTPFYVRFEMTKYLERRVEVYVNGEQAPGVYMELDSNGEAFFVHAATVDTDVSESIEPLFFTDFDDAPVPSSQASPHFNAPSPTNDLTAPRASMPFTADMRAPSIYFDAMHSVPPSLDKAMLQKSTSDYFDAQTESGPIPCSADCDTVHGLERSPDALPPALSLCGDLMSTASSADEAAAIFRKHQVSAESFRRHAAAILQDPSLMVMVRGEYRRYDLFAQALVVSAACFPCSSMMWDTASFPHTAAVDATRKQRRHTIEGTIFDLAAPTTRLDLSDTRDVAPPQEPRAASTWLRWFRSSADHARLPESSPPPSPPPLDHHRSVYPSEAQLTAMNLAYGANTLEFRVQSTVCGDDDVRVTSTLFLWHASSKLVVADIDLVVGSDSFDRSASSAADFFTHVLGHGYQLIYLSSRRRSVRDDLPHAPLLGAFLGLALDTPDQTSVKLAMLQQLQALYPPDVNPFYAGLTNAHHAHAFLHSGLHPGKVLVMDGGRFRLAHQKVLKATDTSYADLKDPRTFDMMFPFVQQQQHDATFQEEAFNDMNFWRLPPPRM